MFGRWWVIALLPLSCWCLPVRGGAVEIRVSLERLAAAALVEELNATLLAASSATLALETWCRRFNLAEPARVTVRYPGGEPLLADAEQRRRLEVDDQEPIRYRRVELVCGQHVLSSADNWYVPGRLTPEMNQALDGSNESFGRVVLPLAPSRRTFDMERLWQPLPAGWERLSSDALAAGALEAAVPLTLDPLLPLFAHRALVLRADGRPIAEVRETYRMAVLASRFK